MIITVSVLPVASELFPVRVPDYLHDWQHSVAAYVRGIAAVGLSLAGAVGLVLALILSGTMQVGSSFAPVVATTRTLLDSVGIWINSLLQGLGPQVVVGGGLVLGLLALIGWQTVSNYHRSAQDFRLEAA